MTKKLTFKPLEAAQAGSTHRTNEHLQGRQVSLDAVIRAASQPKSPSGRKADFPGEETARLNAFLPVDLVRKIKANASTSGKTVSQYVADWAKTI